MKSHVQVAVIGGGVVGCSVLYHLTKLGWKDVCLIERSELTAGSTWHAAGGMHTLNSDPNVAKLQNYTINLYKELEEISGQSCGIHMSGGIMVADTPERLEFLKTAHAKGKYLGLESEFIDMDEVKKLHPLLDTSHFCGALYDPLEGHVDPSGVTHAYAKAARIGGAEIYRQCPVIDLQQTPEGHWLVITEKGTIHAEHVVNCGGLWAREVGRMVGLELPILAMEHQYLITDTMPEVQALDKELPHCIDFAGEMYMRQEGQGLVMGTYEQACVAWSERQTPWNFGHELLNPDLERISPSLEVAFAHVPALAEAGIKQTINGPFTFAPDGNPLVGPVRGLKNFWVACGVMAGFSQGGGVGLALSNWMVHGDPGSDIFAMDVARYGDWASMAYTNTKVKENYQRRFRISYPNEELPAARPHRTTAIYDLLKQQNAVFGASYGLEHALWFAAEGEEPVETPTFRRSNAFSQVAAECHAVRNQVGLLEISNFAKYRVSGAGAASWLDNLLANSLPATGRMVLAPMLNPAGKLIGDFTVARADEDEFFIFGSGTAEEFHLRWFEKQLEDVADVQLECLRSKLTGLSIAGPNAKQLLSRLTKHDLDDFSFMSFSRMDVGHSPALVGRISFTGEQGYEIWVEPDYLRALYLNITEAGADLGLRHFGARALDSLRHEKGFGGWTREFTPDYEPVQAGMGRFVKPSKGEFIGCEAVAARADQTAEKQLIQLAIDDLDGDADAVADEPVFHNGNVVGWVTSGAYGHCVEMSLAQAYVDTVVANAEDFSVEILGQMHPAKRLTQPPYDPSGSKMRSA